MIDINSKLFGDKSTFAISYKPYENSMESHVFAYCHFILGGHFIGSPNEGCLLATWTLFVDKFKRHLESNRNNFCDKLFTDLTDREIFELIMKSNQLESEFDPLYDYLPVNDKLWGKHCVRLDETQDAYRIVVIENNEQLKFIWKGWREPCPKNEIDKLYIANVEFDNFLVTIEECLTFLIKTYPDINIGLK